jgi:hypothetical protein
VRSCTVRSAEQADYGKEQQRNPEAVRFMAADLLSRTA